MGGPYLFMKGRKFYWRIALALVFSFSGVFLLGELMSTPTRIDDGKQDTGVEGFVDEQPPAVLENETSPPTNITAFPWIQEFNQTTTYLIHAERFYQNERVDSRVLANIEQFDIYNLTGWFYTRYTSPFLLENESRVFNASFCSPNETVRINYTANISKHHGAFDLREYCKEDQDDPLLVVLSPVYYRPWKDGEFTRLNVTSPPAETTLKVAWLADIHVSFYSDGWPYWNRGSLSVQIGTDTKGEVNLVILHPCLVVNGNYFSDYLFL